MEHILKVKQRKKDQNGTHVPNRSSAFLVRLFLVLVNFYCHLEWDFKITFLLDYCWVKEKAFFFFNIVDFNLATLFNSFISSNTFLFNSVSLILFTIILFANHDDFASRLFIKVGGTGPRQLLDPITTLLWPKLGMLPPPMLKAAESRSHLPN